jgi:hypothetical protein
MTLGFMRVEYLHAYALASLSPFGNCNTVAPICRAVNRRRAISYRRASRYQHVAINIPAVLDCAGAINNLSGLIEFKRYLGQAVEIAVWMRTHHERNLWFGEPDFGCRFHRTCSFASFSGTSLIHGSHASLSLGSPVRDLLLRAKHLFVEARTVWHGLRSSRDEPYRPGFGHFGNHLKCR